MAKNLYLNSKDQIETLKEWHEPTFTNWCRKAFQSPHLTQFSCNLAWDRTPAEVSHIRYEYVQFSTESDRTDIVYEDGTHSAYLPKHIVLWSIDHIDAVYIVPGENGKIHTCYLENWRETEWYDYPKKIEPVFPEAESALTTTFSEFLKVYPLIDRETFYHFHKNENIEWPKENIDLVSEQDIKNLSLCFKEPLSPKEIDFLKQVSGDPGLHFRKDFEDLLIDSNRLFYFDWKDDISEMVEFFESRFSYLKINRQSDNFKSILQKHIYECKNNTGLVGEDAISLIAKYLLLETGIILYELIENSDEGILGGFVEYSLLKNLEESFTNLGYEAQSLAPEEQKDSFINKLLFWKRRT